MTERAFKIEEVSEAAPVAKAPPLRASEGGFERSPDYLEGFLTKKPEIVPSDSPGGDLYDEVILALRQIFDPEITKSFPFSTRRVE